MNEPAKLTLLPAIFRPENFFRVPEFQCQAHGVHDLFLRIHPADEPEPRHWCMLCFEQLVRDHGLTPMTPVQSG